MAYERKISDEQSKKTENFLKNEVNVVLENKAMLGAQIDTILDILKERELVTEKETNDRIMDKAYTILKLTDLI